MITAFDVYLVMQLDSLCDFLTILALISAGASAFVLIPMIEGSERAKGYFKYSFVIMIGLAFLLTIVPSTKTAAAMIILPKLANEKNVDIVTGEAKELYQLFKQSLVDEIKDDKDK